MSGPSLGQDAAAHRDVERARIAPPARATARALQRCATARATRWVVLLLALGLPADARPQAWAPAPDARAALGALGPAPRDADQRFMNLDGPVTHGDLSVRLGFFARRAASLWSAQGTPAPRVPNDGVFLRENARASVPTVTWIGHATLLVQLSHLSFLTDPIWSETASPVSFAGPRRRVPPGLALEDLPPIDFVLLSHNHYDHLDLDTLERLAAAHPAARFFVPLGNAELLRERGIERVEELDWGETRAHLGVEIACLPARHWSRRGLGDERRALWASWAVVSEDRRFYFAGDTGYSPAFARIARALGPFDLAALPIGAYEPTAMMRDVHLDPEEAVRSMADLQAARAVAIHFGTFVLTDEPLDEPPRRFRRAAEDAGVAPDRLLVLSVGETRPF